MLFDFEQLKKQAEKFDVISFDVFDTLLLRKIYEPSVVFDIVEKKSGYKGFSKLRKEAEFEARRLSGLNGYEDTSLEEIYKVLGQYGQSYKRAIKEELAEEESLITVNAEMKEFYDWCVAKNKKIVAVSDMYLSEAFIRKLLIKEGYTIEDVFVSSVVGKLKYSGQLFEHALNQLNFNAEQVLHIGDNWVADIAGARKAGITAVLYPKVKIQGEISPLLPVNLFADDSKNILLDHFKGNVLLEWAESGKPLSKEELPYWIGLSYVGPLCLLFVDWLYKSAKKQGVKEIYFLRRDGEIWHEIFTRCYPEITSHLIYGNRKLLQEASYADLLNLEVFPVDNTIAFRISHGDNILSIMRDLGFSRELLELAASNHVLTNMWDKSDLEQKKELFLTFIKSNRDAWLKFANSKKQVLQGYYESLGINKKRKDEIAFVDIGWRLSSFEPLSNVLGFMPKAFFMGIAEKAYFHENFSGFLFEYGQPEPANKLYCPHFIEVMETIFGGTEPTALSMSCEGNKYSIELDEFTEEEKQRANIIKSIHSGAVSLVVENTRLCELLKHTSEDIIKECAYTLSDTLINNPEKPYFAALSQLQFSAYAGKSKSTQKALKVVWEQALSSPIQPPVNNSSEVVVNNQLVIDGYWSNWCVNHTISLLPNVVKRYILEKQTKKHIKLIQNSGYFDEQWYFEQYPEVQASNLSGVEHYVRYGVFEARNPNSQFNTKDYLFHNKDVMEQGVNPLIHYILYGAAEGRGH